MRLASDVIQVMMILASVVGINWLAYEVRGLRKQITKPLAVAFVDTLRVKSEAQEEASHAATATH